MSLRQIFRFLTTMIYGQIYFKYLSREPQSKYKLTEKSHYTTASMITLGIWNLGITTSNIVRIVKLFGILRRTWVSTKLGMS